MTDASMTPPAPPTFGSIAKFGTSIVGKPFQFEYANAAGDGIEMVEARANAVMQYEDVLRYTTGRHAQIVQAAVSARAMREELEAIGPTNEEGYIDKFNAIIEARLQNETASWHTAVELTLRLVHAEHRDALRPALLNGDPKSINELRAWLEGEVLGGAQEDAQRMTQVDPTSPPPPESSPSNPDTGDDSDSEESTSTD